MACKSGGNFQKRWWREGYSKGIQGQPLTVLGTAELFCPGNGLSGYWSLGMSHCGCQVKQENVEAK